MIAEVALSHVLRVGDDLHVADCVGTGIAEASHDVFAAVALVALVGGQGAHEREPQNCVRLVVAQDDLSGGVVAGGVELTALWAPAPPTLKTQALSGEGLPGPLPGITTWHAPRASAARLDHLLLILLLTHLSEPQMSKRRAKKILDTFGKRRRMAHAEVPVRFGSAPVRDKAEDFRDLRPRASVRRLFDQAMARAEAAMRAKIDAMNFSDAVGGHPP